MLLIPLLPFIVTSNPTNDALATVYIWFLLDSVVSYLFTYKRSILIADQKNYIVVGCDLLYQIFVKLGQAGVLWLTHSFQAYLVLMVLGRLLENLLLNGISNHRYPYLTDKKAFKLQPEILQDIRQKVKGMFFHKIGSFVVLGTDNILIARFLGLAAVGIYSNYFLIINSIKSICSQILTAATASVGHMLAEKDEKKNYKIFSEMQLLNGMLCNCAGVGIYCVATPVIELLFGRAFIVSEFTIFILALNFYVQGMRTVFGIFKETAGILYEDRYVALIESVINIVASLVFLRFFGLAGVFMGTITSSLVLYFYTFPVLVFKSVLKQRIVVYGRELLWLGSVFLLSLAVSKGICRYFQWGSLTGEILFNFCVVLVVSNGMFLGLYMRWKEEAGELFGRIVGIFNKRGN